MEAFWIKQCPNRGLGLTHTSDADFMGGAVCIHCKAGPYGQQAAPPPQLTAGNPIQCDKHPELAWPCILCGPQAFAADDLPREPAMRRWMPTDGGVLTDLEEKKLLFCCRLRGLLG